MAVPSVNLTIDKGVDFSTSLKLKTDGGIINLTGYTYTAKLRKHYDANSYYTFLVTPLTPYNAGVVKLTMSKVTTAQITTGRYVWDLLITYSGITLKAAEGTVIVKGTAS
jgi:hypothetical protein